MPGRNGTGPMGAGPMTGRGLGNCTGNQPGNFPRNYGRGLGCRRGSGRGFGLGWFGGGWFNNRNTKDTLQEQKKMLQDELDLINRDLEELDKKEQK